MKLLYILRKTPYNGKLAREALDMVLASAAFDNEVSVIFMGDGVFQLMEKQETEVIQSKSIEKSLQAFPLYEIENIFISESALLERGLTDNFAIPARIISDDKISGLIKAADRVLSF